MITRQGLRRLAVVLGGFTLLFCWLFADPLLHRTYLSESDLYDIFLPIFLSPRTIWSSFEFAGMPTFADPENMAWYPLHVLFAQFGAWNAFLISAYVIAASGTYAYVYFHTRSRTAAALAGLSFGLSEAMMERLMHPVIIHALAWVPLLLLSLDAVRGGTHRWMWVVVGTLAAANCVLAGHPQIAVYVAYLGALYAIAGSIADRGRMQPLVATAAMGIVAALISAILLVPAAEASRYTLATSAQGFEDFVQYSAKPVELLSILYPTIVHVGREAPTYVGLTALLLAPLAAMRLRSNWRAGFWLAVVVVALVLAVGSSTPLARLAYELPLYATFRIVARHLLFAALGFSVLAGFGLAALRAGEVRLRSVVVSAVALIVVMVAGALLARARPGQIDFEHINEALKLPLWNDTVWIQMGIALIVAAACVAVSRWPKSVGAAAVLLIVASGDLLHALPYRITALGLVAETVPRSAVEPSVHARRLADGIEARHQRVLAPRSAVRDNVVRSVYARLWKIPSLGGYSSMMLANMGSLATVAMTGRVRSMVLADGDCSLDLLAVKYVTLRTPLASEDEQHLANANRWREFSRFRTSATSDRGADADEPGEEAFVVYENRRALPRAWLAREALVTTDGTIEDLIRTSKFRDGRPFVPTDLALIQEGDGQAMARTAGEGHVEVTDVRDGEIAVTVASPQGGFLVLSEAYYPGWRARVGDGAWQPVTRTDIALQGIQVPSGNHTVTFALTSEARRAGAWLSGLGLVIVALIAAVGARS